MYYLEADGMQPNGYERLAHTSYRDITHGQAEAPSPGVSPSPTFRFNLILSDGMHTSKALKREMESLLKYRLMSDDTVMLWDDCGSGRGGGGSTGRLRRTVEKDLYHQVRTNVLFELNLNENQLN